MVDFTVAIPTYNGATRLPKVLNRLLDQLDTEHFSWEILVVDNNSKDNTAKVVREYQSNWPQAYPLKYVFEAEPGAAFARNRAVQEATGKLIGFLDDDNLPESDWVAAAYQFGQVHPEAGAYGSQIFGKFEVEPPQNFHRIAGFLAITQRGATAHRYEPRKKLLPPGAGLVVRKQAWRDNVPERLVLNNLGKEAGLASEDLEALLYIQKAGWEIWYNPNMQIYHEIPSWRLSKDYLISVARCIGLSRHQLRMVKLKNWQKPLLIPIYFTNDLRRLIMHLVKYKGVAKKDAIVACELELLRCSLISPFFVGNNI
ncbi:hormogonium polysaccharide biosynthesis glycosyltransferase HpsE [Aerosakkonema funiforme]|uniref:Glycosyltransferase family 2 protein n=1 Tax=Aerosakkonema funiforme FACHB-1375 TaxID=2949571 RepID=A0A926ZF45_9CYAN|nr:hormogonium polysaccharide biosynthesis glycosyltransferase HpsE [Aerosakkonema funiforme]MBD2180485.1 glycosyltransferase family 2 protein [Aerosakkonema funiforme FACHB-1375]